MREQSQATRVGLKVLAGLAKGRDRINAKRKAQGAERRTQIYYLVLADREAGHAPRGQARRIRRTLHNALSESRIRKIIAGALFSTPVSLGYDRGEHNTRRFAR